MASKRREYSTVPQEDPIDIDYKPRQIPFDHYQSLLESIGNVLHALLWVALAAGSWYYADVFNVIFHADARINFSVFFASLVFAVIAVIGFLYVFIDNVRLGNPNIDYLKVYPITIHIVTFTGLIFWLLLIVALWPVWGFKTIPLIFINMIGFLMGLQLVA